MQGNEDNALCDGEPDFNPVGSVPSLEPVLQIQAGENASSARLCGLGSTFARQTTLDVSS